MNDSLCDQFEEGVLKFELEYDWSLSLTVANTTNIQY